MGGCCNARRGRGREPRWPGTSKCSRRSAERLVRTTLLCQETQRGSARPGQAVTVPCASKVAPRTAFQRVKPVALPQTPGGSRLNPSPFISTPGAIGGLPSAASRAGLSSVVEVSTRSLPLVASRYVCGGQSAENGPHNNTASVLAGARRTKGPFWTLRRVRT